MGNCDDQKEFANETMCEKGEMETLTMIMSRNVKEGESEVVGINNACRITNEVMSVWVDANVVDDVVNEKGEVMNKNQNWVVGKRIIGIKTKRVEFFIRVKSKERFYEMKSRV